MQDKYKALLKSGKLTCLLIAVCVIAAAAVIFMPEKQAEVEAPETVETAGQTAEEYSAQMVSAITGETNPHVTVTLRSMGETVYATEDRQSERNSQEYAGDSLNKAQTDGDTETTYIIVKDADGAQRPLVVTQTQPEIRGVVIVSRRGGDTQIRERITEAVKTALDLSSTQVCVTGYAEYT